MRKLIHLLPFCLLWYPSLAQQQLKLSALFARQEISLFDLEPVARTNSLYDTIGVKFTLINDYDRDTVIYYSEGYNDWYSFGAIPLNNIAPSVQQVSGRLYYGKIPYEYLYYPAQKVILKAATAYTCIVRWKGSGYLKADTALQLLTPLKFLQHMQKEQRAQYTNNIITYFFVGAISFGFFLFLFLYYKSRYSLFGLYAVFLFFQVVYGLIMFDVYTTAGELFITHFNWDKYVTDMIIFGGQAIYLQFVIGWLKLKETTYRFAKALHWLSIVFAIYAVAIVIVYHIDPTWPPLLFIRIGVRVLGLIFQFIVFYKIIFRIKTAGRWYILSGNLLLMLMGLVMVFFHAKGWLAGTWLEQVDNASWYMLGILCESICFTMGMGLHYFQLQNEKNILQIETLKARQLKLEAEENNLNDRLRISQDLHDSIGSTLSSISVYSQVAKINSEKNEKEGLEELLGKISGTSNEMITEMNDIVWAINPHNDSMEKIVQRMESFSKPLTAARNMHFELQYDREVLSLHLDMDKRKNFYLVFKEAINNAIKYSGASNLISEIRLTGTVLLLKVSDNGVGFNPEKEMAGNKNSLSGNGLINMHKRSKELTGELLIESHPGTGSRIILKFQV